MDPRTLERIAKILEAYMKSSLPTDLEEKIYAWLTVDGHVEEKDTALESLWNGMVNENYQITESAVISLNAVRTDLGLEPADIEAPVLKKRASRRRLSSWMIAAVAIPFAIFAGFFATRFISSLTEQQRSFTEATATGGKHEHLVLADGSQVWLRSGSTFQYRSGRNGKRVAELAGEAYFEVARSSKPFIINTEHIAIEVLGTEFGVSAFGDDDFAAVTLNQGAVRATLGKHTFQLAPGEKVRYDIPSNQISVDSDGDRSRPSWVSGILAFENQTLEEILRITERHFGVRIEKIGDFTQSDTRYTAAFDPGMGIDYVLEVFSVLTGRFTHSVEEGTVRVVFN